MTIKNRRKRELPSFKDVFRRICRGVVLVGMLFLLWISVTGFYSYLLHTPYLEIKEITVLGGDKIGSLEIIEESRVHLGENLLTVDLEGVSERLERNPWVKRAMVKRLFPSGVEMMIEERTPAALIKFDAFYLIDLDGVVFKKMTKEDNIDLPIITGVAMEELIQDVPEASEGVFKALNLIEILDENSLLKPENISEIEIGPSYELSLYTLNNAVKIGIGDKDFRKRLSRFEKITAILKGNFKDVDFIDLDYDKKAVLRYTRVPKGYPI
ncbi:MAG: cell division protein FtsQ/DivIB [Thermodesulfobacteriota bacterium]